MDTDPIVGLLKRSGELLYTHTDRSFRIQDVNDTFLHKLGTTREACLGLPFHEIVAAFEQDRLRSVQDSFLRNPDQSVKIEICVQRQGEENWFRWEFSSGAGKDGGMHIIGQDITRLKQSEKKLLYQATLLESISEAVISTDTDFTIKSWNATAEKIYGLSEQEAVGQSALRIFDYAYISSSEDTAMTHLLEQGSWSGIVVYTRATGEKVRLQASVTRVENADGVIIGYVAVNRVIGEHDIYDQAVRAIDDYAIIMLDRNGYIKDWNQGAERIKGYHFSEIRGQHFGMFYTPEEQRIGIPDQLLEEATRQGRSVYRGWRKRKDGSMFPARDVITPIRNSKGEVIAIFKVTNDLSDLLAGEIAKDDEVSRFFSAVNRIGDNIWEHDFRTGRTTFSRNMYQFLGFTDKEVTDNVNFWWNAVHPEDLRLLRDSDKQYRDGLQNHHSIEYRMTHKNGTTRWVLDRGIVVERDADNQPLRIIGTHVDITDRKTAEQKLLESDIRFRDLVQNVPGVVYQWRENKDGSFGFNYVSPKLKEYFDIAPEDMHLVQEYIHPEDRERWRQSIEQSNQGSSRWEFEGRLLYPDGSVKWWKGMSVLSQETHTARIYNGIMIDITAAKDNMEKLRVTERRYRGIFHSMYQFIGLLSPEGTVLEINETAMVFGGITADDVLGKPFWECHWWTLAPATQEDLRKAIREAASGSFVRYEVWVRGMGETKALIDFSLKPVTDENGKVTLLIPEGRDITVQREAENQLRQEQRKFEAFMEVSPTMAWIVDSKGVFRYMNELYRDRFRLSDDHIGRSLSDIFPEESARIYKKNNDDVFRDKKTIERIEKLVDHTGKETILKVLKFPIKTDGRELLLGGIALDITAQVQTEQALLQSNERYDYVNEATSDAIWDWNVQTDEVQKGIGFNRLFGHNTHSCTGKELLGHLHPEDHQRVIDAADAVLKSRRTHWQQEYRFRCSDGSYKTILDRAIVIRDANGMAVRVIGAMQDVTEQRRLEKRLMDDEIQQKRNMILAIMNAQEKERRELADELHDNVNQILSSSKLMLEVAEEKKEHRDRFLSKSRVHLQEAIDEIRRISHNLSPGVLKDISVEDAIGEIVEKINQAGKMVLYYNVKTATRPPVIPFEIQLNVLRIAQEQLNNIIRHAAARNIHILLEKTESSIRLVIRDDGRGFDSTIIRKGLGLNNIYNRVEYYEGKVSLQTRPGKGCVLDIEIPF